jgi:hypothetical protein
MSGYQLRKATVLTAHHADTPASLSWLIHRAGFHAVYAVGTGIRLGPVPLSVQLVEAIHLLSTVTGLPEVSAAYP